MGQHDEYGKLVFREALGKAFTEWGDSVCVDYGAGQPARIDGCVGSFIAVEIESRTSKQVRGAVLDLICHPLPKKLLVLLPMYMYNPAVTAEQCRFALGRFVGAQDFRVVVLEGTGDLHRLDVDVSRVRMSLAELGYEEMPKHQRPKSEVDASREGRP